MKTTTTNVNRAKIHLSKRVTELLAKAKAADAQGQSASAFEFFRELLTLDPDRESALYRAALSLFEVGRLSDAEAMLSRIAKPPKSKQWLVELLLGRLRMAQFRPIEAEEHFAKARSLNPMTTEPAIYLADCLSRLEKFEDASRVLLAALRAKGDLDEVYLNLGLVKRAQTKYVEARTYLLKALEISPDYHDAKKALSDVEEWLTFTSKQM